MKKTIFIWIVAISITASTASYANWYQDIINAINKQGLLTNGWLSSINTQGSAILESQRAMNTVMHEMDSHLTGHSGWGSYKFHDYQSYGVNGEDWFSVLQMADKGHGSGELGKTISTISQQFPSNSNAFNRGISDPASQNYYAVKSKTVLASRAASQLDYDKINEQIAYQHMLQQQIENTKDLKAAIDLSNRIQVEGNLITLEILRQTALANQQQAINEQASVISSLSHAKFLTKE